MYYFSQGKLLIHLRYDFESNEQCNTAGQILRYCHTLKGYSTRELADKVGIVPATLILYENDKHPIKYKTAVLLAAELGIERKLLLDDYTAFVDYPCNVRLQEVRKQLNMTQIEIAEKIGIASTAYSGWERAVRTPRRKEYENIVAVLNEYNIAL